MSAAAALLSRSAEAGVREGFCFLPAAAEAVGSEGLVTLLTLGPKARVCWARAVEAEGLRRVGGMLGGWVVGCD